MLPCSTFLVLSAKGKQNSESRLGCLTLCNPMDYTLDGIVQARIFPSPGDLPSPGTEPRSPTWQADLLCLSHQGSPMKAKPLTKFDRITAGGDCSHEIKRRLLLGRKVMTNLDSIFKSQRHYFASKGPSSQGYGFSSSHVWVWELDYKGSWALKNWCFWTVVLEKTIESPLYCKEIQQVPPKGDQSWVFIGRTDVEAEIQIFWRIDEKSWLIWKDPDVGKDWGQEEKGMTEDEMIR